MQLESHYGQLPPSSWSDDVGNMYQLVVRVSSAIVGGAAPGLPEKREPRSESQTDVNNFVNDMHVRISQPAQPVEAVDVEGLMNGIIRMLGSD